MGLDGCDIISCMKRLTFRVPHGLLCEVEVNKPRGMSMNAWLCQLVDLGLEGSRRDVGHIPQIEIVGRERPVDVSDDLVEVADFDMSDEFRQV